MQARLAAKGWLLSAQGVCMYVCVYVLGVGSVSTYVSPGGDFFSLSCVCMCTFQINIDRQTGDYTYRQTQVGEHLLAILVK